MLMLLQHSLSTVNAFLSVSYRYSGGVYGGTSLNRHLTIYSINGQIFRSYCTKFNNNADSDLTQDCLQLLVESKHT